MDEKLNVIDTIVGFIGIVLLLVSLIYIVKQLRFVAKQTEISSKSTIVEIWQNVFLTMIEIDKFFITNIDLKQYFYHNVEIPKNNLILSQKIESTAEMIFDFIDQAITMSPFIKDLHDLPWKDWELYFARIYNSSPALKHYWKLNKNLYPENVQFFINSIDNQKI